MTDPRDDDPELVDVTTDQDDEDAAPTGIDAVPDVVEDPVEDDPTAIDEAPEE